MGWRDFFYFSKGERQALVVLLGLIIVAGIILMLTHPPSDEEGQEAPTNERSETVASYDSLSSSPSETFFGKEASANKSVRQKPSARNARLRETIPERVKRLTTTRRRYPKTEKLPAGSTIELNTADTTDLKKVPGIGPVFAKRIVKFRNLLGGYAEVLQLSEVYGIDEEKYTALASWFTVDPKHIRKLYVNRLPEDSLRRHPYINYRQARTIVRLRKQKGALTGWENLQLLDEFTDADRQRLRPYLSFEQ